MATGQTFSADMKRWAHLSKQQMEALGRQSIQALCYRVQANTGPPVGPNVITGFLMGSWQPSIGAPPKAVSELHPDKDQDVELSVMLATLTLGQTFFYVNNAEYAMRQEYGFTGVDSLGRMVHQAGKFFVKKTVAQWPQIVDSAAVDLRFRLK